MVTLLIVIASRMARITASAPLPGNEIVTQPLNPPPNEVLSGPPEPEDIINSVRRDGDNIKRNIVGRKFDSDLQLNEIGVAKSSQFPNYHVIDDSPETVADIAFFLQLSESSLKMAPRLVDRLWHKRNIIVIHVDAKVPDWAMNELKARYTGNEQYSNVHFLPRESITYMGVTMILNTLSAIEYLLSLDQHWDYFINLSGSCYPTMSIKNMRMVLGQPRILKQKVSFLQVAPSTKFWADLKKYRFDMVFRDPALGLLPGAAKKTELLKTKRFHPLKDQIDIRFVHSEAWVTLHRSFAVAAARGSFGRRLLTLFSDMRDPEEHYFATLGFNDPALNKTLAHHAGRSIFWKLNEVLSGQHPYWVDKQKEPNGDYSFWPNIQKSTSMFVRKFSTPDSPLMTLIDKYKSGVHPEADMEAVKKTFTTSVFMTMCHADIERHWNSPLVVPCFKNGNLGR